MPRPPETPDVRASKGLAYILRHGAEKEGLHIRSDGYIRLDDVLARPKMRDVDKDMVLRLVEENAKKRFELAYGYDPSPPVPKKGRGPNKSKAKKQPPLESAIPAMKSETTEPELKYRPVGDDIPAQSGPTQLEDVSKILASATISSTELPLIFLPDPSQGDITDPDPRGGYFIRASQGHSIELEGVAHLQPILDNEEGRKRAGLIVHGTKWELWETLKERGLSRMARQHIHFAPALSLSEHHIIPRPNSTLLIYLDLTKALESGIKMYTSANGVVLTAGNEEGVVEKELWRLAERVSGGLEGARTVVWKDGQEVVPVENAADS